MVGIIVGYISLEIFNSFIVTGLLGLSLGLRTCSYSRASSYYMRLQTPLGDYSREQAKILLPGDHPLVKDIDEFSSILEKEPVDDIIDDAGNKHE